MKFQGRQNMAYRHLYETAN